MAVPEDQELRQLLERFVCVRLVQMWGVDLTRFQFDFAMTWAVFFANADGTIYGRYGSRSAMRDQSARDISVAGFKRSMAATLALHERYVADPAAARREVAGKQTRYPPRWSSPEKIPALAKNKVLAVPFTGLSENRNMRAHGVGCIHCHMVPGNEIMSLRAAGAEVPERLIWPYPMPYSVGMHLDPEQRSTVRRVMPESAAAKAGLQPGDEILQCAGQTIVSTADVQWVLHNLDDGQRLSLAVNRGGETKRLDLELAAGWRRRLGDWRFVNMGVCMQIAGFNGRPTHGGGKALAIQVNLVHRKRLAGVDLKRNDVVVALDGDRAPKNLGQLTRFLLDRKPGSTLELTVARGGKEMAERVKVVLE